jgi:hypothetical protein
VIPVVFAARELLPIAVIVGDVLTARAETPIAVEPLDVVFAARLLEPIPTLSLPLVFANRLFTPRALLKVPVVLAASELLPTAVDPAAVERLRAL